MPNNSSQEPISIDRTTIINIVLILEGLILFAATIWIWLDNIQLSSSFKFIPHFFGIGSAVGATLAVSSFCLVLLGKKIAFLSQLREIVFSELAPLLSEITWIDALLIACISGFCEEVFFRGVMQTEINIWFTSIVFGCFHCPNLKHFSYGLWAFAASLLLGWLYIATGNLWTPICAHIISNAVSLIALRMVVKSDIPRT